MIIETLAKFWIENPVAYMLKKFAITVVRFEGKQGVNYTNLIVGS
jgi:hypothetical protein